jgi:lipopolysaccharide biosynthesis regulator YciM
MRCSQSWWRRRESRDPDELKRLVFAAIAAGLTDRGAAARADRESLHAQDATLQGVWRSVPGPAAAGRDDAQRGDARRIAREIGALLANAEKYRCNECGFAGRNFYWHCPACHAWDSFEAYAIVKLG